MSSAARRSVRQKIALTCFASSLIWATGGQVVCGGEQVARQPRAASSRFWAGICSSSGSKRIARALVLSSPAAPRRASLRRAGGTRCRVRRRATRHSRQVGGREGQHTGLRIARVGAEDVVHPRRPDQPAARAANRLEDVRPGRDLLDRVGDEDDRRTRRLGHVVQRRERLTNGLVVVDRDGEVRRYRIDDDEPRLLLADLLAQGSVSRGSSGFQTWTLLRSAPAASSRGRTNCLSASSRVERITAPDCEICAASNG